MNVSSGIPTSTYYTGSSDGQEGPESPVKYHEAGGQTNGGQEPGHDTFSDFVTLVCQEAGQTAPGQHGPKSPTKLVSYYSSMYPPAPTPPMARPVHVKMDSGSVSSSPPPLNMQIAGQPREVRMSPSSPDPLPRTILYTYSGGATITLPECLSPANLSIVQPPRVSASVTKTPASSSPASIRWATSNGAFISDIDSSGIAYDLMTPMISGSGDNSGSGPGATLHLTDGQCHSPPRMSLRLLLFSDRYFNTQLEPMDATVGGVSSDPTSPPSR